MKNLKYLFFVNILFILSCGGGGSGTSSRFDGTWKGELSGTDCDGIAVFKTIIHEIDADSDEIGAAVTLNDEEGNTYSGQIDGTASIAGARYGFSVTSQDKPESVIDYNTINTPEGVARVIKIINLANSGTSDSDDCSYQLSGEAKK